MHIEPDTAWVHSNVTLPSARLGDNGAVGPSAVLTAEATITNEATERTQSAVVLRTTLIDAHGHTVATATSEATSVGAGEAVTVRTTLGPLHGADLHLWNIQNPYLYTMRMEVASSSSSSSLPPSSPSVLDAVNVTTGVRDVHFDADAGLFINAKRIKMRGFCDHSNFGGVGAAVPDRMNLFRTQALRQVGGK